MPEIALTEPQEAFVLSEATHPAIIGGLGSGKSRAGTMRLLYLMLDDPGINTGYYMPTYDLLRLRAMPGIEADLEALGIPYTTNRSEYSTKVHGYGTIIFRSYDRPERIIAYEVAHSIVDELDTLRRDNAEIVWRKVSERNRMRSRRPNSIGLVTTPDQGVTGFAYEKWGKSTDPEYPYIKASTYSNPFNPKGYAANLVKNYDPILAELYLMGEFVALTQNKVYHFFSRETHGSARVLGTVQTDPVVHVGLDFNIGGCCAVGFVIDPTGPVAVDEFVSHDTRDFINRLSRYAGRRVVVYPDASGRAGHTNASESDISMIRAAGFQVEAHGTNPPIRDRVNAYNAMLAHGRLAINTAKCPNLTDALETQGYDERGEPQKWTKHPAIDDWADASGYFIAYRYPIGRALAQLRMGGV